MPKITRHGGPSFAPPDGGRREVEREVRTPEPGEGNQRQPEPEPGEGSGGPRASREEMRRWALSAGYVVPARGRLSMDTIRAYRDAHGTPGSDDSQ